LVAALLAVMVVGYSVAKPRASDKFRLEGQATVVKMVVEKPLGVGPGWFADYADSYLPDEARQRQERTLHRMMDPHNALLLALAEFGWGGAAVLIGLVLFWLRTLLIFRKRTGDFSLLAGALAFLATALVSTPGRTASGMLVVGLLLGFQQPTDDEVVELHWLWRVPMVLMALAWLAGAFRLSRAEQSFRVGLAMMNVAGEPKYNIARKEFGEALQFDSGHRSARLGYVKALFGLNQWDLAFRAALPLLQSGAPPESLLRLVIFAGVRSGDPKDIAALLNRYQQRVFGWPMLDLLALGQELLRAGLPEAAAELLDQPRVKENIQGTIMLALARLNAKQPEKVIQVLRDDLRRPTVLEYNITLALAYESLQQYHESEAILREADALFGKDAKVALYLGRDLWLQKRQDEAVAQIVVALQRDPSLSLEPASEPDPVFKEMFNDIVRRKVKALRAAGAK